MRNKYQKLSDNRETTPFMSSEEAWFWYCLCEQLGFDRGHGHSARTVRPCETSDIILAVKHLLHNGYIGIDHIRVLQKYGFETVRPSGKYFTQNELKAGDILICEDRPGTPGPDHGHTEIYIGNGKSYSAGSTSTIQTMGGSSTNFSGNYSLVLRLSS